SREQQTHFARRAAAEFDELTMRPDQRADLARAVGEDRGLGPCRIVFWRLADRLEKLGAVLVIKEAAGDLFLPLAQPGDHAIAEALGLGSEIVKGRAYRSSAH